MVPLDTALALDIDEHEEAHTVLFLMFVYISH